MAELTFLYGLGSVAARYGVAESIFLHTIVSLVRNNKANNRNFRDGRWWTYNSMSSWSEQLPWWTPKQMRSIIERCIQKGALVVGEYNRDRRDRTAWYSPSDELLALYQEDWSETPSAVAESPAQDDAELGKCKCPNGQMHLPERATPSAQMGSFTCPNGQTITIVNPKESTKNPSASLREAAEAIEAVELPEDAAAIKDAVAELLTQRGFDCRRAVPAGEQGRVAILAERDGVRLALELAPKSGGAKALAKLRACEADGRILLLREPAATPPGIDLAIALRLAAAPPQARYMPAWFDRFWARYPRHENRYAAIKAWDRLRPPLELCRVMAAALSRQTESEQWRRASGQYVPQAAKWLTARRWEDEPPASEPDGWDFGAGESWRFETEGSR